MLENCRFDAFDDFFALNILLFLLQEALSRSVSIAFERRHRGVGASPAAPRAALQTAYYIIALCEPPKAPY